MHRTCGSAWQKRRRSCARRWRRAAPHGSCERCRSGRKAGLPACGSRRAPSKQSRRRGNRDLHPGFLGKRPLLSPITSSRKSLTASRLRSRISCSRPCFLSRLTGSLCDAVAQTADAAAVLERLERENVFIVPLQAGGERPGTGILPCSPNPSRRSPAAAWVRKASGRSLREPAAGMRTTGCWKKRLKRHWLQGCSSVPSC